MYVELGKIVGVWGVKGWVKLHSYTRNRADIAQYSTWYLQDSRKKGDPVAIDVLKCREQGQGIAAQLEGVNDRDQAAAMSGRTIFVKQADLPALPNGEFYWQQLIGLTVSNDVGKIGVVASIVETGANDVLVVEQDGADLPDVLIPYTNQAVLDISLEKGVMSVDWDPSYLLD